MSFLNPDTELNKIFLLGSHNSGSFKLNSYLFIRLIIF